MDIELYLILSAAYEYTREPISQEDEEALMHRRYIRDGIETYFHKHGYVYESDTNAWKADIRTVQAHFDEIARCHAWGERWPGIRRAKQQGR